LLQVSADLTCLTEVVVGATLETLGFGAPEAVVVALGAERRGGFPPVFALAATAHCLFHMLTIKTIAAARAHLAICVHSFNWVHK
jgi:hypothetical protein